MAYDQCIPPTELIGYGAFLRWYDRAGDAWVLVAGTDDLALPDAMREFIETNGDNGDGTIHRIGVPQIDYSEQTYKMDFLVHQFERLNNLIKQNPVFNTCWQIVFNTPTQYYYEWCGGIKKLTTAIPKKEVVKSEITIIPTGGHPRTGYLQA